MQGRHLMYYSSSVGDNNALGDWCKSADEHPMSLEHGVTQRSNRSPEAAYIYGKNRWSRVDVALATATPPIMRASPRNKACRASCRCDTLNARHGCIPRLVNIAGRATIHGHGLGHTVAPSHIDALLRRRSLATYCRIVDLPS